MKPWIWEISHECFERSDNVLRPNLLVPFFSDFSSYCFFFFFLHRARNLEKSISFGTHRCCRLSTTRSEAWMEVKYLAVSCAILNWTLNKAEHRQVSFSDSGDKAQLSGKLMEGCSPKWEMAVGTLCNSIFPHWLNCTPDSVKRRQGKWLKRIC